MGGGGRRKGVHARGTLDQLLMAWERVLMWGRVLEHRHLFEKNTVTEEG